MPKPSSTARSSKKIDAILVLVDVVEYTPQARQKGSPATKRFDDSFAKELTRRAKRHGFEFIKSMGDAALLWGHDPEKLTALIVDLFKKDPIPVNEGFVSRLRLLAHKDYFTFTMEGKKVLDVHGLEAIVLFRLEKQAHLNRAIVTPHLFAGLRDSLGQNEITFDAAELPELKGVGGDSPRQVYILRPPLRSDVAAYELPKPYIAAREVLRQSVQTIPVFGQLYPATPMSENFLNLTLSQNSIRFGNQYGAPDYDEDEQAEIRNQDRFLDERKWREKSRHRDARYSATELFERFKTAVIAGLPGAGKTTILRHCAWQALEADPHAVVVFIEAKYLRPEHLVSKARVDIHSRAFVFQVLTKLFLFPGSEPKNLKREEPQIAAVAQSLEAAWTDRRAIVLLDALDEAPTVALKEWLLSAARTLMQDLEASDKSKAARCLLSTRQAELHAHEAIQFAPVLIVNSLEQEQFRTIAKRRLGADSPQYAKFDAEIPYRRDILQVAGTPLTAMLMVFFYQAYDQFGRRFQMYQLLVWFVLDLAWQRIKVGDFGAPHSGMSTFFHDVSQGEEKFFERRPGLELQYRALGCVGRWLLYGEHVRESALNDQSDNRSAVRQELIRREVGRAEMIDMLLDALAEFDSAAAPRSMARRVRPATSTKEKLQREQVDAEKRVCVEGWLKTWESEHILLPAGPEKFVFIHSTVLEFLAAVDLKRLLAVARLSPPQQADLQRVFVTRLRDELQSLPILCSSEPEVAWHVLERLAPAAKAMASGKKSRATSLVESFEPTSLLPYRCVSEMESAERGQLAGYAISGSKRSRQKLEAEFARSSAKRWAYDFIARWVMKSPTQEMSLSNWLQDRLDALANEVKLWRPILLDHVSPKEIGAARTQQISLVMQMLAEPVQQEDRVQEWLKQAQPRSTKSNQVSRSVESRYFQLMRRMRGAEFVKKMEALAECRFSLRESTFSLGKKSNDQNLAYYRAEFSPGLVGFYGSPNFKHAGAVNCVAYSPDGKLAVSASGDRLLILWDVETGREVRRFVGHRGEVYCCAFSPDGGRLLSGSYDRTLKLWDVATGAELRAFTGHSREVNSCAFSPDGGRLLSGSDDYTLKLWDTATGVELRAFIGHADWVRSCAFSPDGRLVISGSADRTLKLWEAATGVELRVFAGHAGYVRSCAFSPDSGRLLSGSDDCTLKLWDAATGAELRAFRGHSDSVISCAFSSDGGWLLSGSVDRTLKLWDAATGAELRAFTGHANSVRSCAFSPDGGRLISGSADRTLKLWDSATGAELRALAGHADSVRSCVFSPDGGRVLSGSADCTLKLWDATTGTELRALNGHAKSVMSCAFSPNGSQLLSGSDDRTLKLWDAATGAELRALTGPANSVMSCAFSPDGSQLLSGAADRTLKLWDSATGAELRAFRGHAGPVRSCAFGLDGSCLLSGSSDSTLKLWDSATGAEVRAFRGHADSVMSCAFNPDSGQVLSGSADRTLKLWDAATGAEVRAFRGHADSVRSCTFSPDGGRLLSGSSDKTVRLWEAYSGMCLGAWNCGWSVNSVAFHPQQPHLVIAALANGTVALIDTQLTAPQTATARPVR